VTLVITGVATGVSGTDLAVPPPSKERPMSYPCLDTLLSCREKPCSYHMLECIQSCIIVDNARKESTVGFSLPDLELAWIAMSLPRIIMPCQVGVPVIRDPTSVTSARGNGKSVGIRVARQLTQVHLKAGRNVSTLVAEKQDLRRKTHESVSYLRAPGEPL